MNKPERIHTYTDMIFDSARWDNFHPRKGDVIVATPAKCGTTWTQMLCALLVHQTPNLPQPLTVLSRWLDRHSEPVEDVVAHFNKQPHRRIVKTHTPLDGLPYWDDVHYVFCGRDPRDAFLSAMDHMSNVSEQSMAQARRRGNLPDDFQLPTDPNAMFPLWLTTGTQPWVSDGFPAGSVLYFTSTYWKYRDLPNIVFLHYADLMANRETEMRRLSKALGIPIQEERWPTLIEAAGFAAMKEHASDNAPGAHLGEWAKDGDFFRKARSAEWRDALSAENQALYERISTERLEPNLKKWLEGGRKAFDPAG
ncbi:MAG: sulfotransferase domain-containing protein [Proteobacteria bacterium]|nr:sulfotransferase domain-containing protein [Pseudomonadota bacterium]